MKKIIGLNKAIPPKELFPVFAKKNELIRLGERHKIKNSNDHLEDIKNGFFVITPRNPIPKKNELINTKYKGKTVLP